MRLVADTNALFSFFRENPVRFIITNSKVLGLELITPQYAIDELKVNIPDLIKYTKLSSNEIEWIFKSLEKFIDIKPKDFFEEYKLEGLKVSPDPKDAPFFALALKIKSGIWSNEPRLKKQSVIKVLTTSELKVLLKIE